MTLTEREVEQLICAGALDVFTTSHRQARWEAQVERAAPKAQPTLLPETEHRFVPSVAAETAHERAREEYASLGWTRSVAHPMAVYAAAVADMDVLPVARLVQHVGHAATVAGIIVATRHIRTQQGRPMLFLSLCDASGVVELVLFDTVAQRAGRDLHTGHVICAHGHIIDDQGRGVTLEVPRCRCSAAS